MSRRAVKLTVAALVVGGVLALVPAPGVEAAREMRVSHAPTGLLRSTTVGEFRLIGVSWPAGTAASGRVRVRHGDRWSDWHELDAGTEDGPDRQSPEHGRRVASRPLWVDVADGFEVEAQPAHTARVELVREGSRLRARAPGDRGARGNVPMPTVKTRDAWEAREPESGPVYGSVRMAFVHHTVSANDYAADDVPSLLRGMQAFHMDVNGWKDIGYNFLIDRFGRVWEGRAGGVDRAVTGAQTEGFNSVSTGVAVLGTFSDTAPSGASVDAAIRLLAWKLPHHGVDPAGTVTVVSRGNERYPEGSTATFDKIAGHRDAKPTDCPGADLYSRLPFIRAEARSNAAAVVAYAPVWAGGVFVATGQLDVRGSRAIITGADAGGGPDLRTFDPSGALRTAQIVFPEGFRGGVRVAAGNLDSVPGDEVVVAAGAGGGPHVRVLREEGLGLSSFMAYTPGFTGGVYVATGNVDGVPGDEIVTGPGPGGGPHVRVFRLDGTPIGGFMAFDPNFRGGVRVATGDVDGDGVDEIIAGAGPGGGPHVRALRIDGIPVAQFFAYAAAFRGGVHVASIRDGSSDLVVTGAGEGGGPQVRVFDRGGAPRAQFFAGRSSSTSGVRVASGPVAGEADALVLAPGPGAPPLVKISRTDGQLLFPT